MRKLSIGALVASLCILPYAAGAGIIQGTVEVSSVVPAKATPMNAYPGRAGSMPGMHAIDHGRVVDTVVYVESVPASAESALAATHERTPQLAQEGQAFVPRVLAVAVGGKVDFPNHDPIYHNVFSLSPARRFDLGKYPKGSSRQVVFPRAGLINVYCDIHTDMEAFILVVPNHAFTRPSTSGEYALPELPAGRYVVHAWHPDLGERHVTVDVPGAGPVTANLSL